ncbi:MAG: S-layer-like domain-containing protein [Parcubacteria group bacterium Licking1014_17]|nr:MAG: S-layer-like domain-containing protein [Parcubacteria group bacterium Licking1014_17]
MVRRLVLKAKDIVDRFGFKNSKRFLKITVAILAIPLLILVNTRSASAEVAYYYSPLCLGNWKYVKNIEEEPQVPQGSDASNFNNGNSAVLKNVSGQVYCGKFATQNSPSSNFKKINLKFSMAVADSETKEIKSTDFEKGVNILDTDPDSSVLFTFPESNGEGTASSGSAAPTPSPSSEPIPQSAQTDTANKTATPSPESSPAVTEQQAEVPSEVEVLPAEPSAPAEPTPEPPAEQAQAPVPVGEPTPPAENNLETPVSFLGKITSFLFGNVLEINSVMLNLDDIIEVFYTTDGENWTRLGTVNNQNRQNVSFEINLDSLDKIADLQIMVSSLPTLDSNSVVYLDSMWLEVEYSSGVVDFVKDMGENVIEILTNNEPVPTPAGTPSETPTPVPLTPTPTPAPQLFIDYSFVLGPVSEPKLILDWYPREKVSEVQKKKAVFSNKVSAGVQGKSLVISGSCVKPYYVVILYKKESDYTKNPSAAVLNSAYPCEKGKFEYTTQNPNDIPSGSYYLLVAEQGEGPWEPISQIQQVDITREEIWK